jgi:flagellar motor switch/type III secretory pathway protein FliN
MPSRLLIPISCSNGLSIAFTLSKGRSVQSAKKESICTICEGQDVRPAAVRGNWIAGEERSMNTAMNSTMPVTEARSVQGPKLVEKSQERDPAELLPWLPCTLVLDIPVVKFTVSDLLNLTKGSVVATAYHQSSDLPLRVNGQLVGWTEFEVVGERLAVRLTDLS